MNMKSRLIRVLIRIEIILVAVTVLFSVILFGNELSKKHLGFWFETGFYGVSMNPTITEDSLVLLKSVPFDDVEVGDCIQFKKRVKIARTSSKTRLMPAGSDEMAADSPAVTEEDYPILYEPDESVLHRVVEKAAEGLITKGDNNSGKDQYPVIAEELIGKVIWTKHGLGWPFCVMYKHLGLFWVMGAAFILGAGLAIAYCITKRKKQNHQQSNAK